MADSVEGPFATKQILDFITAGLVTPTAQLCRQGTENWSPVSAVWPFNCAEAAGDDIEELSDLAVLDEGAGDTASPGAPATGTGAVAPQVPPVGPARRFRSPRPGSWIAIATGAAVRLRPHSKVLIVLVVVGGAGFFAYESREITPSAKKEVRNPTAQALEKAEIAHPAPPAFAPVKMLSDEDARIEARRERREGVSERDEPETVGMMPSAQDNDAATPTGTGTHEVFNTSSDPAEPWLALRDGPYAGSGATTIAQMPDSTKVEVFGSGQGLKGNWLKLRVVGGPDAGKVGFSREDWVRPVPASGQEVAMQVPMAHIREQGIDFVVFDADARVPSDRQALLGRLAMAARRQGLKVDKAALAYVQAGRPTFYGTPDLVRWLATNGVPTWTHTLTLY